LNAFQSEPILPETAPAGATGSPAASADSTSLRRRKAAPHLAKADALESRGWLRQALDEILVALTIDPADPAALQRRARLEDRIETGVTARVQQAQKLSATAPLEARRSYLAALALNPTAKAPFEALRTAAPVAKFLTHTVQANDTTSSLADLYYGDRSRSENIEQFNGLQPGARLTVGSKIKIPEIPGVAPIRPDR